MLAEPVSEPPKPVVDRHPGDPTKVGGGGARVEPVGGTQLLSNESGERRFRFSVTDPLWQPRPHSLQYRADGASCRQGNVARHKGGTGSSADTGDEVANRTRFAIGNDVGPP